jgi:Fic-DOC domain mobile mystery protein B
VADADPLVEDDDAANTPLSPAARQGLIPTYVTTRAELNAVEQENIAEADLWAFERKRPSIVDVGQLLRLHRLMFKSVWRWAGRTRDADLNIGVAPHTIEVELRRLVDDARYWIEHRSFPPDEIAARFHHRLTAIHPFANGNGRHARLAADLLIHQLGGKRFTWGSADLQAPAETRKTYVAALKAADAHDIAKLLAFLRT